MIEVSSSGKAFGLHDKNLQALFTMYGTLYVQTISYHHLVKYGGGRAGRRQVEGRGCLLQGRHTHILTHVIHVVCPGHLAHNKSYKNESCKFLKLSLSKINATLKHQALVNGLTYLEAIEKSVVVLQKLTFVFTLTLLVGTGFVLSGWPKIVIKQEENCLGMFFKFGVVQSYTPLGENEI